MSNNLKFYSLLGGSFLLASIGLAAALGYYGRGIKELDKQTQPVAEAQEPQPRAEANIGIQTYFDSFGNLLVYKSSIYDRISSVPADLDGDGDLDLIVTTNQGDSSGRGKGRGLEIHLMENRIPQQKKE